MILNPIPPTYEIVLLLLTSLDLSCFRLSQKLLALRMLQCQGSQSMRSFDHASRFLGPQCVVKLDTVELLDK